MIRRDVPQITVNFHNHHIAFPAGSETKTQPGGRSKNGRSII